ncbi:helix-turn-helix domain-containing protein [Nannocystis bainbridge]|uniref:Helix-turn-helix transcriptional regulator n=1 Tax=Nannocystis bainbridge TaxID=2995303 RepID=A0ABT5DYH4_9BACT|nr:helix-turn-helix transcriptional regulator [Nannocystis bainbridge]MDC0718626.1 helix-turn-helix transcriptional regulator [Nannocystis bainbridge]
MSEETYDLAREQYERRYMAALAQRIRAIREERGLTQQSVARAAGIASDMVSRLENGHYTSPGLRTLLRIADGMGVPLALLLPELPGPAASPESTLLALLNSVAQRAQPQELELLLDLARVVIGRDRP